MKQNLIKVYRVNREGKRLIGEMDKRAFEKQKAVGGPWIEFHEDDPKIVQVHKIIPTTAKSIEPEELPTIETETETESDDIPEITDLTNAKPKRNGRRNKK